MNSINLRLTDEVVPQVTSQPPRRDLTPGQGRVVPPTITIHPVPNHEGLVTIKLSVEHAEALARNLDEVVLNVKKGVYTEKS